MKRYPFSSFVPLLLAFASLAGAADRADSVKAAAERLKAETGGAARVSLDPATGTARFVRLGSGGPAALAARTPATKASAESASSAFFRAHGGLFGLRDAASELALVGSFGDRLGGQHLVYEQRFGGVPVFGAQLRTHVQGSAVTAVNGAFVPDIALKTAPSVGWETVAKTAVAKVRADKKNGAVTVRAHKLFVYREGLLKGTRGENRLVWEIEVGDGKSVREFVYLDAHNGKFVDQITGVHDAMFRRAYDGANLPFVPPAYPGSPFWVEGDAFPTGVLEADNMIVASEETYNLFQKAFNRDSIDGNGALMDMIFNRGYQCPNASWNGTFISFCPGYTTDDVTGHEWGHAYTQFSNNLIYAWQSGALNESYSDIWGETIDLINNRGLDNPGDLRNVGACSNFTSPSELLVNAPANIAGNYQAGAAAFGTPLTPAGVTGDVVRVDDGVAAASVNDGCETPFVNAAAVNGKIALIDRGTCGFIVKVKNAQLNGAVAVIVANIATSPAPDTPAGMSGFDPTVTISSLQIGNTNGNLLRAELAAGNVVNTTLHTAQVPGAQDSLRWLMGEEVPGGALRDMWTPSCLGNADSVSAPEYWCAAGDNGGVHLNSSVPNHTYALLVDGGTFNGQTIEAIGLTKAAQIHYRVQSTYTTPSATFAEHADGLEQACADLTGVDLPDLITGAPSGEAIGAGDCDQVAKAIAATELRTPPTQCAFEPLLAKNPPPVCAEGTAPVVVLGERFDKDPKGWTISHDAVTPADFTPRDWHRVSSLPDDRAGSAMFAPSVFSGTCLPGGDESGVLHLTSPTFKLPNGVVQPLVTFEHWMSSETAFDGGNLKVSVNGGPWQVVASGAFTYNPYNAVLLGPAASTNPMAGEEAFNAADGGLTSGSWGISRVDLTGYATAGDSVQLRFDFGQDCGTGWIGWYVTDIGAYACASTTPPSISVSDISVTEGNSGLKSAKFTVSLSSIHDKPVLVLYVTSDGSARVFGLDYLPSIGVAVIEPGSISTDVGALVIGDRRREADETFNMNLLLTNRGSILDSRGICTITNDDN